MDTFTKQPNEVIYYTLYFNKSMNEGDSINTQVSPIVDIELLDGTGDLPKLEMVTVNVGAGAVKLLISGGAHEQVCLLTCRVQTNEGETLEGDVRLKIKEIR